MITNKHVYCQGTKEPTPGKKPYQVDPFKNFDKNFDRAVEASKVFVTITTIGSLTMAALVIWVAFHFLSKWW